MIKVERPRDSKPSALDSVRRTDGTTEKQRAIRAYEKLGNADQLDPKKYKFDFKAYRKQEVKDKLAELFKGKCAYCESSYSGTQPMDVEHWRPKGEVHLESGDKLQGYFWLASDWDNLLPSCIDCNRSRKQWDVLEERTFNVGKANQFPVEGTHLVATNSPHLLRLDDESPVLLHPCKDEPAQYLKFGISGEVRSRGNPDGGPDKGFASISVYALNRSGLVMDRLEVVCLIQQRVYTIRALINILDQFQDHIPEEVYGIVEDLLGHEMTALLALQGAERPFSELARQIIEHYAHEIGLEEASPIIDGIDE
ncbi:MAG: hypothetical protein DRR06_08860 [Gammaproteobacteria bacterium]|nr:MAG: hypothetical protein DRR06_08860 [Gammaproteobacteria bacterium]RLA45579.1 MAG: hypothetical protein DRR42_19215 [Gammaproteobacteria bacterium]